MHNAALAELGLNWRYLAFAVHLGDLQQALQGAKAMRFIGINLTVPHKLLALGMVDQLDPSASAFGAVNTIAFEGKTSQGRWLRLHEFEEEPNEVRSHGFNTDAEAIVQALRDDLQMQLPEAKVLLLGTGGAGRTAALKLAAEHVGALFLVNRTQDKAEQLAREITRQHPHVRVTIGYPSGPVDLLLNATSLGLKPTDALPVDEQRFSIAQAALVYDMIYRPAETPLLSKAKAAGCRSANGLSMLLYQGAKALEIWSGKAAPLDIMRRALEQNVYG